MKIHGIYNVLVTAMTVFTAAIAVLLVGIKLFGITPYVIMSPSMEPEYRTGSLVYVKEIDAHAIKPGDVITFRMDNGAAATHRVTEITEQNGELVFHTKGDANKQEDTRKLREQDILGRVILNLPMLGYIAAFINTSSGKIAAVLYGMVLLVLIVLSDGVGRNRRETDNKMNDGREMRR